eukprot:15477201-Alexandrium_andersonii.AAC.1
MGRATAEVLKEAQFRTAPRLPALQTGSWSGVPEVRIISIDRGANNLWREEFIRQDLLADP